MNHYRKGYVGELQLVHELYKRGYMAIRAPRSGRISIASPDIVAAKNGKLIVIECKSRRNGFSVIIDQLKELEEWQEKAAAIAFVAWKIPRKGWTFLRLQDVIDNGGNVGKKFAQEKGFPIDNLPQMLI